ncbi:MAG: response regulator [Myxococcota bacterium]
MRILIAEDDVTSRALLRLLITKRGHEPVVTVNGTEALSVMQQPDAPSLAILDWMMPELDGIDVCRRIREFATERPPYIIMLTTKGETADVVAGLVAGADDYLTKPFDANELYARVDVGRRLLDLQAVLAGKVEELRDALAQIKTLRGTVPICACCKKIRDDKGYWKQVEVYVRDHTEAQFSHGICPECSAKLYPE